MYLQMSGELWLPHKIQKTATIYFMVTIYFEYCVSMRTNYTSYHVIGLLSNLHRVRILQTLIGIHWHAKLTTREVAISARLWSISGHALF